MIYRTVQGDTWDSVAFQVYGDEQLMTMLMNANPNHAATVIFSRNIAINVPDKPVITSDMLPPWRRED
ncbi:tail protein [Paenibacillus sp. FSL H7-0357]|uniref:tail protein X n=1 Tax=unclassified Paenibacillus TaxID=185978 RepID=UPI0004F7402C|nr:tail protein X [Paenibacillus sp. FSL H7-0357]AIQ20727.1 tail protein [Paenibacillus sp. FSL H7-0357]